MNILRRIQYSKIGRIIFKKGPLLAMARLARRIAMKIKFELQERFSKKEKLVEVLRAQLGEYQFQMPETDEVIVEGEVEGETTMNIPEEGDYEVYIYTETGMVLTGEFVVE